MNTQPCTVCKKVLPPSGSTECNRCMNAALGLAVADCLQCKKLGKLCMKHKLCACGRMLEHCGGECAVDMVNSPAHYGSGPYEVVKVLKAWGFFDDAMMYNVIKYVARAPHKGKYIEDLKKAIWHIEKKIAVLEE